MAVVVVANDSVRLHDMGDTDGTTGITSAGAGGPAAAAEPDFVYQGSNSVSRKIGTTIGGFQIDTSSIGNADMTTADRTIWMVKQIATNSAALLAHGTPSLHIRLGSDSSNYYTHDVAGNDTYPIKGGWLVFAFNPNEAAYQSAATGTPVLTAVDYFACRADFGVASKGENLAMDALDVGIGLTLVGGDSTDPDGVFADFVTDDEGTATAGRFGYFTTSSGILFVHGNHWIGRNAAATTTATVFNDTFVTLVFPDGPFASGDAGFSCDLGNATTDIDWTSISFLGQGTGYRLTFDTETEVAGGATDEIQNIPIDEAATIGDAVIYRTQSGTESTGGTDGTRYWVGVTGTGIQLHNNRNDSLTGTSPVGLTASSAGNGEKHRLDKDPDTRPTFTATGTSGDFDAISCTFSSFNDLTLTSVCTLLDCVINNTLGLTQSGAVINGVVVNGHDTLPAESFITSDDPADISNGAFNNTGGEGHAVELTSTGTVAFSNNSFTGYDPVSYEKSFDTITDVDDVAETITITTHPYTTGDSLVYSDEGLSDTIGITDNTVVYINSVDANTISVHLNEGDALNDNARINLTDGASGQIHKLYGANAAIWNNSGGAVTLNVTNGGDTPSIRNQSGSTTTVNNAVMVTVTGVTEGAAIKVIADATVGGVTAGDVLLEALADSSGEASFSHNYEGDLAVIIRARQQGLPNAGIADDNGSFVDETTASNSTTINDMNLLPTTPVVNEDRYLFGHFEQFGQLKLDISTAGTGGFGITWQYFNGTIFTALSGVTDGTSSLSVLGESTVSFTIPGDWATTTINSQGPFFYIRAAYTSGSVTITPLGRKSKLDVTRYRPFVQAQTIISTGLTATAVWVEDTIASF